MYEKTLALAGLNDKAALVYETLLSLGKVGMKTLTQKLPYKRANTYNLVADLIEKGLVIEAEERGRKVFMAENPAQLVALIENEQERLKNAKSGVETLLPTLKSLYGLALNKPGIRFFEGLDGIKQVLEDSLANNPHKRIAAFSDVAGYAKYLKEWNETYYAPKRKRLGIRERVIIPNNAAALAFMRDYQASDVTEIVFVDAQKFLFASEINLYDDRASFVTFSEHGHIGVLIENREIFQTLSSIFEIAWTLGRAYYRDLQPTRGATPSGGAARRASTGATM